MILTSGIQVDIETSILYLISELCHDHDEEDRKILNEDFFAAYM